MNIRDKALIVTALTLLSGLAWAAAVYQAGSMGLGIMTCSMTMGMPFDVGWTARRHQSREKPLQVHAS